MTFPPQRIPTVPVAMAVELDVLAAGVQGPVGSGEGQVEEKRAIIVRMGRDLLERVIHDGVGEIELRIQREILD